MSFGDFFQNLFSSQNSFRNTIRVSNSLDPDQDLHSVGPDLGPNHVQRLSADDTIRHRGKTVAMGTNNTWANPCDDSIVSNSLDPNSFCRS